MLIAQRPVITQEKITSNNYKFIIEPLEPGFGYTLGNSLRRTLLSSIPGGAVTSIKIEGVRHEFETIEGVKEDVTEVVMNIKNLYVSSHLDDPVAVSINVNKPGAITAADIKTSTGVRIHNPELHIATLSKGTFSAELVIERGRGYVSASDNKKLQQFVEIDRIIVDSIYSPVLRVSYSVEATRVGQHTNFDKLIMDVVTKPSLSPIDAMASAGRTLIELFGLVNSLNSAAEGVEIGEEAFAQTPVLEHHVPGRIASTKTQKVPQESVGADSLDITELDLKTKALNILKREGINTVGQLRSYSEAQLLKFDGTGAAIVTNIKDALSVEGLKLAE